MVARDYDDKPQGAIPRYLVENGRFCVWKYETRRNSDGTTQRTKVPYNPHTGHRAESDNPGTFSDYETARAFAERYGYDGVGVGVFDELSGIDIDHCIVDGELTPLAREIVDAMDTYTEISPSGTGLRLFFLTPSGFSYNADVYYINNQGAGDRARDANPGAGYLGGEGLEIYVAGMTRKYMTVTGRAINSRGIEPRADRL